MSNYRKDNSKEECYGQKVGPWPSPGYFNQTSVEDIERNLPSEGTSKLVEIMINHPAIASRGPVY